MTGEGINGLGPTFCSDCKTKPDTSILGENHPICRRHYDWLQDWFREFPERKLGWDGEWDSRTYGWFEKVNETHDNTGTPGDNDKPYVRSTPSQLLARGALSTENALKMFKLRDAHYGKGLREEQCDELYRIS